MPRPFHWRLLRFDLLYLMPWESGVVCRLIGGFWDIVRIKVFTDGRLDDWRKRLPTPLIYHIRGRYPRKSRMAVNSILFSPIDEHWSVIQIHAFTPALRLTGAENPMYLHVLPMAAAYSAQ